MSCRRLLCAHCGGPVSEARCPTCRAWRAQLHERFIPAQVLAGVIAAALVLLAVVILSAGHFAG